MLRNGYCSTLIHVMEWQGDIIYRFVECMNRLMASATWAG
jgi:hypothetical protein